MRRFRFVYRGAGGREEISVAIDGTRGVLSRGEATEQVEVRPLPDGRLSLVFEGGRQICGRVLASGVGQVEVVTGAGSRRIALAEPLRDRLAHPPGQLAGEAEDEEVRALMPGRVIEVSVAAGNRVSAGALLLVLEAMKMQNEIRAERGGAVLRVEVEPGRTVESGALLMVIKSEARQEVSP